MTIDVTIQACGADYREAGVTVHLPPEVLEVRYNPAGSTRTTEVSGDRRKLARTLREAGYQVDWTDPNPAVALASRTSPARAAASRANGALSPGRPVVQTLLAPEAFRRRLARIDKGTLTDLIYVLLAGDEATLKAALTQTLALRGSIVPVEETAAP